MFISFCIHNAEVDDMCCRVCINPRWGIRMAAQKHVSKTSACYNRCKDETYTPGLYISLLYINTIIVHQRNRFISSDADDYFHRLNLMARDQCNHDIIVVLAPIDKVT